MDSIVTPQVVAAFMRTIWLAALTFGMTTLTMQQTLEGSSWQDPLIAGGIAALAVLIGRTGGEGLYDSRRQAQGNINDADVKVENVPAGVPIQG